jgi:predicted DNA-binding transcriptional regulator AlpA
MELDIEQLAASGITLQLSAKDLMRFAEKLLLQKEQMMENKIRLLNEETYYTTKEVQEKFKVSRQTIFAWQRSGLVKPRKLGGKNMWLHSEILKIMYVKY